MNRIKDKNHMSFLVNTRTIQQNLTSFPIKSKKQTRSIRKLPQPEKGFYGKNKNKNLPANIIHNNKKLKTFPLRSGTK